MAIHCRAVKNSLRGTNIVYKSQSFSGNICLEFSLLFLRSVEGAGIK
jgi:hypothetical protein